MKHFDINNLFKKSKQSPVNKERLSAIREEIVRYVEMRPINKDLMGAAEPIHVSSLFNSLKLKPMFTIIVAVAVALAGGGTVAASQNDLPGQALYNVKLASENVVGAFTFSDVKKAEVKAKVAAKRANELAALAKKGDKPSQKSVEVTAKRYEKLLGQVEKITSKLSEKEKLEVAPKILAAINAALSDLAMASTTYTSSTVDAMVSTTLAAELAITAEEEAAAEKQASLVGLKSRAENKINQVTKKVSDLKKLVGSTSSTVSADTAAKVTLSESLLAEAQVKFASGTYAEAFDVAKSAQKAAIEAKKSFLVQVYSTSTVESEDNEQREEKKDKNADSDEDESERKNKNNNGVRGEVEVETDVEVENERKQNGVGAQLKVRLFGDVNE